MSEFFKALEKKNISLPHDVHVILSSCKSFRVFNTVQELADAAVGGAGNKSYEVKYDVPGKGEVVEAVVHRVKNGIAANYMEAYMRRRDPDTMVIADDMPTDKPKFADRFGYEFQSLRKETAAWLRDQDLAVFVYFAGFERVGSSGIVICPANAAFFAMGLGMLQQIIPIEQLEDDFILDSVLYVAPTFRHTHFGGKQVVVHARTSEVHEMFAYNLYPGPSAKKGLYGVLLSKGEREGWITAHCSTVQVVSPYDNVTTFMHEGASGGGKSEMLQDIVREDDGQILLAENILSAERRHITLPRFCKFNPVTDDMALCHPSVQKNNGKLAVLDAENSWFLRVDGVKQYGDDPHLEKLTINSKDPLLFLNLKSEPDGTVLIWQHTEDSPGKTCPNPRVVVPRKDVPNVVNKAVYVDVRSFGVRTPPCTAAQPSYGIMGVFHILPPALAWLWRLVSPRGHGNPSIISTSGKLMESEGVGSYWPFAAGKMVDHANLLLEQILDCPNVRYTLVPNQHIGAWKVGFKPQLIMREYLTRRGAGLLRADQYQPARCPLLGYELNFLTLEGEKIPRRYLQVYRQNDVGEAGYDAGAEMLYNFFKEEIVKYKTDSLHPLGHKIIDACLAGASIEEYLELIPMNA